MASTYGRISEEKMRQIEETDAEILLLCGGHEGGNSRDLLYQIEQAEKAGFRYGESEAMLYFREEIYRMMKEATDITEEEIDKYFRNLPEEEEGWPDLTELAESIMAR